MKKQLATAALIALMTASAGIAHAQTAVNAQATVPTTSVSTTAVAPAPTAGVAQIDQRLQNQQTRTDAGVTAGQIGAKQEMRDTSKDARVSQELSRDEAKNGGTVTKAEQKHMNKQLNGNSKRIHDQRVKAKASGDVTAH